MAKYEVKDGVGIIPEGTTEIGMSAFEDCKELTSVIIPNSVTEIRNSAFSGCSSLNSIVIPDSVTEIGQYAFSFFIIFYLIVEFIHSFSWFHCLI